MYFTAKKTKMEVLTNLITVCKKKIERERERERERSRGRGREREREKINLYYKNRRVMGKSA
jgi:hypothetical protein